MLLQNVQPKTYYEDVEFGLTLYALNHLVLTESTSYFRRVGMPVSAITPTLIQSDDAGMNTFGITPLGFCKKGGDDIPAFVV